MADMAASWDSEESAHCVNGQKSVKDSDSESSARPCMHIVVGGQNSSIRGRSSINDSSSSGVAQSQSSDKQNSKLLVTTLRTSASLRPSRMCHGKVDDPCQNPSVSASSNDSVSNNTVARESYKKQTSKSFRPTSSRTNARPSRIEVANHSSSIRTRINSSTVPSKSFNKQNIKLIRSTRSSRTNARPSTHIEGASQSSSVRRSTNDSISTLESQNSKLVRSTTSSRTNARPSTHIEGANQSSSVRHNTNDSVSTLESQNSKLVRPTRSFWTYARPSMHKVDDQNPSISASSNDSISRRYVARESYNKQTRKSTRPTSSRINARPSMRQVANQSSLVRARTNDRISTSPSFDIQNNKLVRPTSLTTNATPTNGMHKVDDRSSSVRARSNDHISSSVSRESYNKQTRKSIRPRASSGANARPSHIEVANQSSSIIRASTNDSISPLEKTVARPSMYKVDDQNPSISASSNDSISRRYVARESYNKQTRKSTRPTSSRINARPSMRQVANQSSLVRARTNDRISTSPSFDIQNNKLVRPTSLTTNATPTNGMHKVDDRSSSVRARSNDHISSSVSRESYNKQTRKSIRPRASSGANARPSHIEVANQSSSIIRASTNDSISPLEKTVARSSTCKVDDHTVSTSSNDDNISSNVARQSYNKQTNNLVGPTSSGMNARPSIRIQSRVANQSLSVSTITNESTVSSELFDKQKSKSVRPSTTSQSSVKTTSTPHKLSAAVYQQNTHSNCLSKTESSRINPRPSVEVKLIGVGIHEYLEVEKSFQKRWTKLTAHYPVPPIPLAVYSIHNEALTNRYHQYKKKTFSHPSDSNEEWHFHGTSIECDIINSNECCGEETCAICGISRNGFDLSCVRTRKFQRFGKGIYLAPNSSKSNDYAIRNSQYGYKAQLLCLVACGNKHILHNNDTSLVAPPANCHSVYGKASATGKLNYDEIVVYDSDAVAPRYIIVYSRSESSRLQERAPVTVAHPLSNKPLSSHTEHQMNYSHAKQMTGKPAAVVQQETHRLHSHGQPLLSTKSPEPTRTNNSTGESSSKGAAIKPSTSQKKHNTSIESGYSHDGQEKSVGEQRNSATSQSEPTEKKQESESQSWTSTLFQLTSRIRSKSVVDKLKSWCDQFFNLDD